MSSPTTTPRRTPKGTKRSPLQERTPSQKNSAAGKLKKDSRPDLTDAEIFTANPFPTKPQHILLPSTIRKQRSRQNAERQLPDLFFDDPSSETANPAANTSRRQDERKVRRAPNLQLKRSVTALRDMYEAQAESSRPSTAVHSRPSTAAPSPALRPSSSRLRSFSSSDGLSGRGAWEMLGLPKVSEDDLATLPELSEGLLQRLDSEHSFASRLQNRTNSSSPHLRAFGQSSPQLPSYHDVATSSSPPEQSSTFTIQGQGMSSPNVVQVGHTSSDADYRRHNAQQVDSSPGFVGQHGSPSFPTTDMTQRSLAPAGGESSPNFVQFEHSSIIPESDPAASSGAAEEESSPNLIKLGTSSPKRGTSPTPSDASTVSRKRKRPETEGSAYAGRTPLFFGERKSRGRISTGSPQMRNVAVSAENSLQHSGQGPLPSSPPEFGTFSSELQPTSSPVIRLQQRALSAGESSIISAHTNLQSILSSSPVAPIQRPVVRAPDVNQFARLSLQKRDSSGPARLEHNTDTQLSPVPSVTNLEIQQISSTDITQFHPRRDSSRESIFTEDLDDNLDAESLAPAQAYMHHHDLNSSQVNIISDADRHEAADGLSALPRQQTSFAAALSRARSASFMGSSASSSVSRLDSLRNSFEERVRNSRPCANGRLDSSRSSVRPGSSGSFLEPGSVPTWARRYYSGFYRNSFHYLYQSTTNLDYSVVNIQPPTNQQPISLPPSIRPSSSYETISSRADTRRSWSRSARSSIRNFLQPVFQPIVRPRLNVRQSHITRGVGPLVSNPTRPSSEIISRPISAYRNRHTVRRVSMPATATDPRYHWSGIIEEPETAEEAEQSADYRYTGTPRYSTSSSVPRQYRASTNRMPPPMRLGRLPTPHLHQDVRLHTGSEASQGFGAPYNARPRWQPQAGFTDELGQPSWLKFDLKDMHVICFTAGFLCPLIWFVGAFLPLPHRPQNYYDLEKQTMHVHQRQYGDVEDRDIIARLRLEKHIRGLEELKWQNARWWRRMNRWMCCVGLVVLVVMVILVVIGTRSNWS